MREIKYRLWDPFINKMEYLLPYTLVYETTHSRDPIPWENTMQYTGLKDKNGVEIYEGDICIEEYANRLYIIKFGDYNNGQFYEDNESGYGWYKERISFLKTLAPCIRVSGLLSYPGIDRVIGNIYENPELIDDKK